MTYLNYTTLANFLIPALVGFIFGVIIKPWFERNILYKWLPPLEIYTGISDRKRPLHIRFETKNRLALPIKTYIALINKSNETLIIKNIEFSVDNVEINKGGVTWVNCITDDEEKIKNYVAENKEWVSKNKPRKDKGSRFWGGTTSNLIPLIVEPNKSVKLYVYIEPVINTRTAPNKITTNISLVLNTSKRKDTIKFGKIIWEDMSKFDIKFPTHSLISKNR